MGMPDQVRRQAERANELLKQTTGQDQDADPKEGQAKPEPGTESAPEPTAVEQVATPPSEQPAAPAAPPTEQAPAQPQPKVEDWEQKYRTLQGVLRAEQGAWNGEKRALQERIRALEDELKTRPAADTTQPGKRKLVTDQDVDTYGPELLDVIGRKAAEIAEQMVEQRLAALAPELEKTKEQVGSVATQVYRNAQDQFYGELAKVVSDWETINQDQRWLEWLAEVDPLSGVPRQRYLDNAAQQLDHVRAARLFMAFKEAAGLKSPETPTPAPTSTPNQGKPNLSPSPRTVGNATAPTPREPDNSVSRSQIAAHYRRAATDPSYRTSEDYQAMEKRIAHAMATGQVKER